MTEIVLNILGIPTPQGSKRAFVNKYTGRAQMREETGEKLSNWRNDVKIAALTHIAGIVDNGGQWRPLTGPLQVDYVFRFERPKAHYGSGRNAHLLKDSAPTYPISRNIGDIEKLMRSTNDALTTAGLWEDDCLVVGGAPWKVYAPAGEKAGARLVIRPAPLFITTEHQTASRPDHSEQGVLL